MKTLSGKTYSLFSNSSASDEYFTNVKNLVDKYLKEYPDEKRLLVLLQKTAKYKGIINKLLFRQLNRTLVNFTNNKLKASLAKYTTEVKNHRKSLPLHKRFDSILRTDEYQYYLYMLEIELVNRIYKNTFKSCTTKIAFFPHCLRDFRITCLSTPGDVEHICKGCTKDCYIHRGSKILKKYNIESYISVTIDQVKLFKNLKDKHQNICMLGIACIPELVRGMRLCIKLGIPPVGIPLDVNNCARWRGKAYETSFNIKELENLVK